MMSSMSLDMLLRPLVVGYKMKEINGTPDHSISKHQLPQRTVVIAPIPRSRESEVGYYLS